MNLLKATLFSLILSCSVAVLSQHDDQPVQVHLVVITEPLPDICNERQPFTFELYQDTILIFRQKPDSTGIINVSQKPDGTSWIIPDRNYLIKLKRHDDDPDPIVEAFNTHSITKNTRIIREIKTLTHCFYTSSTELRYQWNQTTLTKNQIESLSYFAYFMKSNCLFNAEIICCYKNEKSNVHFERVQTILSFLVSKGVKSERLIPVYNETDDDNETVKLLLFTP